MAATFVADNPNIALTAGTAKSVLVLNTGSAVVARVIDLLVSCDATATGLLKVELLAGTLTAGTTGTAPNAARMNAEGSTVAPGATLTYYTAEPTYTKLTNNGALAIRTMIIPLPSTPFEIEYPLGREFFQPVSSVIAVRMTSTTVSPNVYTSICWEE